MAGQLADGPLCAALDGADIGAQGAGCGREGAPLQFTLEFPVGPVPLCLSTFLEERGSLSQQLQCFPDRQSSVAWRKRLSNTVAREVMMAVCPRSGTVSGLA